MSSKTLSSVTEKHIRHLCLTDFPCGNGSWRKTKDGAEAAGTEDTDALLDLLSCPRSPWWHDLSWSPQAVTLRELSVLSPERLHADFIYNHFTTLRIVDKGVSVIDEGLLKFSKLEELVLSANRISEIPAHNLPSTLKILELRANCLSALNSLTCRPPPLLQYLGLGSNGLGSHDDVSNLTGRQWPQLVCLDLSDCQFLDQKALLSALRTLPCLKTLVLEGNPFTLVPSYPGLAVDTLPLLSCLDNSWVFPEERHRFRGLAKMSDLIMDQASLTVSVGRMKGMPDPLMSVDENTPDFPVVAYSYFISYEFLSHQTPNNLKVDTQAGFDTAHVAEDVSSAADLQSSENCKREASKADAGVLTVYTEETGHVIAHVSKHSTSKLTWSECMDFSDTHIHVVSELGDLKKFLNQGLNLWIEEEKVLSWPAASEDIPESKPNQAVKDKKGMKGRESPIKSTAAKDKSKDKKKKTVLELVQDAPIRRSLGSIHIPLQSLVEGDRKVAVLCNLGFLRTESEMGPTQTHEKDPGKKIKEEKKKEDKESKLRGGKGKGGRNHEADVHTDNLPQPVTVEVSVELEKWQSTSEAHQLLHPHQTSQSPETVSS
ncbi:putative leucine-rich repeat-containing protein 43 [Scophthalmus maximus]|uniref:Putative leucine-rich repeat-containing protein 43 n=1 Tax=Scophthalmus maximus TaxID=52904 RepID=A0A2U9BVD4_SCOMX|nr:putative leucine-rich repeat-containing protein 43 [Scophthalmus maximus]